MGKKAHPERCNPKIVAHIINSNVPRWKAWTEYTRLHYSFVGQRPTCTEHDFIDAYDKTLDIYQPHHG